MIGEPVVGILALILANLLQKSFEIPLVEEGGSHQTVHLDVVNGVGGLNVKSDCLASQGKDLHASAQAQHQMQRGLFLDVVV